MGAPSSTNTKHATASANFLWISTPYEFISCEVSTSRTRVFSITAMSAVLGSAILGTGRFWSGVYFVEGVELAVGGGLPDDGT